MDKIELQDFIYSNIPIVEKNNLSVGKIENLTARILGKHSDHSNHRDTVFGGSISTVLILAAWSHLRLMMEQADVSAGTVVGMQNVKFHKPVTKDFFAIAVPTDKKNMEMLFSRFKEKGKARLRIKAQLSEINSSDILAEFEGDFFLLSDTRG